MEPKHSIWVNEFSVYCLHKEKTRQTCLKQQQKTLGDDHSHNSTCEEVCSYYCPLLLIWLAEQKARRQWLRKLYPKFLDKMDDR